MPSETTCDLAAIRARHEDRFPLSDDAWAEAAHRDRAALLAEVARLTDALAWERALSFALAESRERQAAEVVRLRAALAEASVTARTDEREACAQVVAVYSEGIAQFIRDRALDDRAGSPATTGGTPDAE